MQPCGLRGIPPDFRVLGQRELRAIMKSSISVISELPATPANKCYDAAYQVFGCSWFKLSLFEMSKAVLRTVGVLAGWPSWQNPVHLRRQNLLNTNF